jgi:GTP-binding protein
MTENFSNEEIEAARKLFAGPCDFMLGVADLSQLPDYSRPEIAFAGRSNVGKSSLINALTGRNHLAHASNTPGRTQQLNFFDLGGRLTLVDMPGYGYAKVSKEQRGQWEALIFDYLRGRPTLRCCLLLVDSRHGLKDSDEVLMEMLDRAAVSFRVILTKADKKAAGVEGGVLAALKKHPAAYPDIITTSAEKGTGIPDLRALLASFTAR